MGREIKARAWNKVEEKMYTDAINNCKDAFDIVLKHPQIYDVTLDTTLSDKNGVNIHDGDILRYYSDARMYVPIGDGKWGFKGNPHLEERTVVAWSDEIGAYMVHGNMFLHEINQKSEVIGNMFENPELMEA